MNIAVLGTGMVGKAHAARLIDLGHDVAMGTRDVAATQASGRPDHLGQLFNRWHQPHGAKMYMPLYFALAKANGGNLAINVTVVS